MEQTRLRELEAQCIEECTPPCTAVCPVHVDVRSLARSIVSGDLASAAKTFCKSVPFPGIIARTCDQPCQKKCMRQTLGGAIAIADLERASVEYGKVPPEKTIRLPAKDARVAVIGGGLSGLTAALDLARKGYAVSLFEAKTSLGGRLLDFPEEQLPRRCLAEETALVARAGVEVFLGEKAGSEILRPGRFDAIFLGTGGAIPAGFESLAFQGRHLEVDPITFQTSLGCVFAGGSLLHEPSTILSLSEGRRAAISIDRFLQKVSLTASRNQEGAYETKLVTNLTAVTSVPPLFPGKSEMGFGAEEADAEARRCLQCDCMECVKVCEYLRHYGSYPKKYVREIYNNLSLIMRTRTANKMINSCTLCGLCGEVCPTDLDMGRVNLEVRQSMVNSGKMPLSAHDFALRDMAFSNSEKSALTCAPQGSETCSYLFFPGCQLSASNPEYIPQLYQSLSSVLPDLGVMLRCCGAPAAWAGETALFQTSIEALSSQWLTLGKPKLVLACSSCREMLAAHLPGVAVLSIWEIFEQFDLYPKDRKPSRPFVIHDPCTSRYEANWQNAVRSGLKTMEIEFHELELSRKKTECCGYGGVAWLAHPELVEDMIQRRIGEDPADYLTYCVMCRDLFATGGKRTLHLLDLVYGKDLERLSLRQPPDYSLRHENRIRAKQHLLKTFSRKDPRDVEPYEKIQINLSPETRALIESRLILLEDVQKVIDYAETSQERFIDQENGHVLAYFKPNLITYWVEYSKVDETFQVHNAYSHRMNFEGDAKR